MRRVLSIFQYRRNRVQLYVTLCPQTVTAVGISGCGLLQRRAPDCAASLCCWGLDFYMTLTAKGVLDAFPPAA